MGEVYCRNCENLLVLKKRSKAPHPRTLVVCVARCTFLHGALRKCVDLVGWRMAEVENVNNDCPFWTPWWDISFRILKFKWWLRKYTNSRFGSLRDYSIEAEKAKRREHEQQEEEREFDAPGEDDYDGDPASRPPQGEAEAEQTLSDDTTES